jgi:hypothetical protein
MRALTMSAASQRLREQMSLTDPPRGCWGGPLSMRGPERGPRPCQPHGDSAEFGSRACPERLGVGSSERGASCRSVASRGWPCWPGSCSPERASPPRPSRARLPDLPTRRRRMGRRGRKAATQQRVPRGTAASRPGCHRDAGGRVTTGRRHAHGESSRITPGKLNRLARVLAT